MALLDEQAVVGRVVEEPEQVGGGVHREAGSQRAEPLERPDDPSGPVAALAGESSPERSGFGVSVGGGADGFVERRDARLGLGGDGGVAGEQTVGVGVGEDASAPFLLAERGVWLVAADGDLVRPDQQGGLAADGVEDGGATDARAICDVVDRGGDVAVLDEELGSGGHDRGARRRGLRLADGRAVRPFDGTGPLH